MHKLSCFLILLFLASCSTRGIMPGAIAKGESINIRVVQLGGAFAPMYYLTIQENGEEYELILKDAETSSTYKLPANKLELLSEMEVWFKDLSHITKPKYFGITITSGDKTKYYKVNTDIVHDFITGLKKN